MECYSLGVWAEHNCTKKSKITESWTTDTPITNRDFVFKQKEQQESGQSARGNAWQYMRVLEEKNWHAHMVCLAAHTLYTEGLLTFNTFPGHSAISWQSLWINRVQIKWVSCEAKWSDLQLNINFTTSIKKESNLIFYLCLNYLLFHFYFYFFLKLCYFQNISKHFPWSMANLKLVMYSLKLLKLN